MPKLTPEQIESIRDGWSEGACVVDLAAEFGISERHVRRLVGDVDRDTREPFRATVLDGESAEAAVRAFLATLDLDDAGARVLAASALTIAKKLDHADARSAAGLAARLHDLVDTLRAFTGEPSALDVLLRRRQLRRAGVR